MRFIPDALKQSLLDVAPAARPMVEARVETAADLRQRKDQWSQVDGGLPGTIEPLNDGGIRLLATAGAAVGPSAHPVYFTSKDTNVAGEYIDPISTAAFWSGCKFVGVRGRWTGTAANVAYGSVQAFLNPRVTGTINKYVQTWELIIYQLAYDPLNVDPTTLQPYVTLQPLVRAYTDAKLSDSPAVVTFNFTDNGLSTGKSTPWHPDVFVPDNAADPVGNRGAEYFIAIHGYDATGARSINIGWGYDNTQQSFASGSGSNFVNLDAYEVAPQVAATIPGGQVLLVASGIPHLQFVPVTFASTATVTFSAVPLDLGSVPSAASLVEFAIRAETPLGTSAPAQVQVDPAGGYVSFTDGQTADVLGLAAARKYDIKVTLNASSALDRTPIVRLLGARVVAKTDLGDVAEVIAYNEHTDPITHVSEIETCTIRGYHDGERDYRAQVQNLLSQNAPGQFYFRLYIGDRKLSKPDQWLHLDDFFPEDVDFQDAWSDILCVSCLSQLRQSPRPSRR